MTTQSDYSEKKLRKMQTFEGKKTYLFIHTDFWEKNKNTF